jgi:hypothetical protein
LPLDAAPPVIVANQLLEDASEHASALPLLKATMARGTRAKLLRQRLPLTSGAQAIQDAGHDPTVTDARSTTVRFRWLDWYQALDTAPQFVWNILEVVAIHFHRRSQSIILVKRF